LLVDGGRHRKLVLIRDVSHPHIVRRSVRILPRGVWSAPRVDAGRAHALAVSGTRRPADRAKGAAALQKVPDRRGAYIPERGSGKRAAQVSCGTSVVWSSVNPAFAWQSSAAAKGAPQMKAVQSRRSRAPQAVNCNRPCDTPYVSTAETVTEGAESVQFLMRRRLDSLWIEPVAAQTRITSVKLCHLPLREHQQAKLMLCFHSFGQLASSNRPLFS
jgi:hypothetical protein